jgi:hypothetical protein
MQLCHAASYDRSRSTCSSLAFADVRPGRKPRRRGCAQIRPPTGWAVTTRRGSGVLLLAATAVIYGPTLPFRERRPRRSLSPGGTSAWKARLAPGRGARRESAPAALGAGGGRGGPSLGDPWPGRDWHRAALEAPGLWRPAGGAPGGPPAARSSGSRRRVRCRGRELTAELVRPLVPACPERYHQRKKRRPRRPWPRRRLGGDPEGPAPTGALDPELAAAGEGHRTVAAAPGALPPPARPVRLPPEPPSRRPRAGLCPATVRVRDEG